MSAGGWELPPFGNPTSVSPSVFFCQHSGNMMAVSQEIAGHGQTGIPSLLRFPLSCQSGSLQGAYQQNRNLSIVGSEPVAT